MLELRRITKQFGPFIALQDVDFAARGGEIVGLLGENGAGKSTLIGIVGGNLAPTSGELIWNGQQSTFVSPRDATRAGIGVVHQHFRLVPVFTVAENLALQGQRNGVIYNASEWEERIVQWCQSLNWRIDPRRRIDELSVGERQRVEILKALFAGSENHGGAQLLLFDEPTANLAPPETAELFQMLHGLREQGRAIVFVSHKLDEVLSLCDRVAVLRRGQVVGERKTSDINKTELAALMVGHELESSFGAVKASSPDFSSAPLRLNVQGLAAGPLREISLQVRAGEIVGIAGVDGNGQSELVEVLCKLRTPSAGTFHIDEDALALIPPDRQQTGLILPFDLAENLALQPALRTECRRPLRFDWKIARQRTRDLMQRFDVRTPQSGERSLASQLSGGNQQKLVIARALSFTHRLVVAADPTRGLDVGAAQFVHEQLRQAAQKGAGVLLISTDLDEVLSLSDRIGVLYEGRLLPGQLLPAGTPREQIGALMGGVTATEAAAA